MSPVHETERPLQRRPFPPETLDQLREAGFAVDAVSAEPERIRVMKDGCALLFERQPDQSLVLTQKPGYLLKGEIGRLWDAGYQKFWLLGTPGDDPFDEARRPALAAHLMALHRFEEDIKSALGLDSFYNESIGSTSKITAYDRACGRDASAKQRW